MGGNNLPPYTPIMDDKFSFQERLNEEPDGTYITSAQMQFFLNRENGKNKFKDADPEFLDYYNLCRVYNLISDIMEDDDDAAIMYWDDKKAVVSIGFPTEGIVAKTLSRVEPHGVEHGEEDEEGFGLFDTAPWQD